MLCESCKVNIDGRFEHAIRSNQCPACGNLIMSPMKLSSYLSLKELLVKHFPKVDAEGVSSLIVANFEIKQSFRNELIEKPEGGITTPAPVEEDDVEVEEEDEPTGPVVHEGVRYEKVDKSKAQAMLQKMRDEALNDALNDRDDSEDLADEAEMLMSGDESLKQEYLLKAKREAAAKKIRAGVSAFSRT